MLAKHHGRLRAHKLLAKAGYGKNGAARVAGGVEAENHAGIKRALADADRETRALGESAKSRLDRKPRASGGVAKNTPAPDEPNLNDYRKQQIAKGNYGDANPSLVGLSDEEKNNYLILRNKGFGDQEALDIGRNNKARGGANKWVQKAHLKKGTFTAQAKKAGESVHEFAENKKDASGKTGKRARLALIFQKMAKK